MGHPTPNIEALRERIEEAPEISDEDREMLLRFSDRMYLLSSEYGDHRHGKNLRHCTIMAEKVGGLAESLTEREAAERLVLWINKVHEKETTNHDYRTALRVFGRRVSDDDEIPPSLAWIPSGTSSSYNPIPDPADMLRWEEDVLPMVEAACNARDAALITTAFDAGPRSEELQTLTIGNVSEWKHGLRLLVDGKTGQRSVPVVACVPYLNRWLSDHPDSNNPDAPLWSKLSNPEEITYRRFLAIFSDAARRAGVTKTVTPTNFRKSNATYLVRTGLPQAEIEERQGRKRGSEATAHYIAKFGGETDENYARLMGIEIDEEESEPIGPLQCPRCEKKTPRHKPACVWCQQALDYGSLSSLEEEESQVRDAWFRFAQENPTLFEDLQRARELTTMLDGNSELFEDVQAFADAMASE